jgi:uncharacterized protein (DUF58 family)
MFSRLWIGSAVIVLAIGLATRQSALGLLALLVLLTAAIAAIWNRLALSQLACEQRLSAHRAFPDDLVTLTIQVKNRKPLPLSWLTVETELASALQPVDRDTTLSGAGDRRLLRIVASVRPLEQVVWNIPVRCQRRGYHAIGPITLRASDPFGFFATRRTVAASDMILIYPRLRPLGAYLSAPAAPLGDTRQVRQLLTDPTRIVGTRDYRPDDPFRLIHWKATARLGSLQVRLTEPATTQQMAVFLNIDTFEHYWEGLDLAMAEHAIEVAAAIAAWCDAERYPVGLYAHGVVAGSDQPLRVSPGRGPTQLQNVLEGLARISPYSTVPIARVLGPEATRLPWGSTVVIVSALVSDAMIAQMVALLASGRRVVFIVLGGAQVPPIPGLIVHRVEFPSEAAGAVAHRVLARV